MRGMTFSLLLLGICGASCAATTSSSLSGARAAPPARPPQIVSWPIPYGPRRRAEMAAYAHRHYGVSGSRLIRPRVIVEHFTETSTARAAYNTFAPDVADPELHELPGVCAHFVVDANGTIYQLVSLDLMCRHTVGLNYTAIGIEHVGFSDGQVLGNRRQLAASLALTRWLRCRFRVGLNDVIGHNESLSSRFHLEKVARLRRQTHNDFIRRDMDVYRTRLARLSC
ncbi:MAG: hypothetical protein NVSMB25_21240 [Thermoleophilaceae bacterium]